MLCACDCMSAKELQILRCHAHGFPRRGAASPEHRSHFEAHAVDSHEKSCESIIHSCMHAKGRSCWGAWAERHGLRTRLAQVQQNPTNMHMSLPLVRETHVIMEHDSCAHNPSEQIPSPRRCIWASMSSKFLLRQKYVKKSRATSRSAPAVS